MWLFTTRLYTGKELLMRIVCPAGVAASPICRVPPVTLAVLDERITSAVALDEALLTMMLPPVHVNGTPELISKAPRSILVDPALQTVTVPPVWV